MSESRIFCSYAPGAGKTTCMLQSALQEKGLGHAVSFDFVCDTGRPIQIEASSSYISGGCLTANPRVDPDGIIRRHPEISVLDEMLMLNLYTKQPLCASFQLLSEHDISIYTSANLFQVRSICQRYRRIADIDFSRTIPNKQFLSFGKLVFIDIEPELLLERYHHAELFPQHRLELIFLFKKERLVAFREICMEYLAKLKPGQYEIWCPSSCL